MDGAVFVGLGNLFGMVALLELGESTHPSADISLSIVRTLMIRSSVTCNSSVGSDG